MRGMVTEAHLDQAAVGTLADRRDQLGGGRLRPVLLLFRQQIREGGRGGAGQEVVRDRLAGGRDELGRRAGVEGHGEARANRRGRCAFARNRYDRRVPPTRYARGYHVYSTVDAGPEDAVELCAFVAGQVDASSHGGLS